MRVIPACWAFGRIEGAAMRIRLLLAITATVVLAACGESSSTAPQSPRPGARSADEITCRSGYHIATREDGSQYCEPDAGTEAMGGPITPGP